MSLPLATLRELHLKLAALKAKGVILERQYEDLRSSGVFSEAEWTTQVDGDISGIINSARPTLSSDHAAASRLHPESGQQTVEGEGGHTARKWRTAILVVCGP
ncbi:unnamed protein product [Ectocarpus sp. CCAP 1310/34]|nr:unnamed protein product [Ectocarpus sp. CCAP 1310/34]